MWKKNLIFKNIIHVYEWYIETFISKQKIYEDWAYIFDSKPATLFIPCSVLLNFAVFKLIPIFILIHKWILWHLSLACGHNCLGCYRINARQVLLKKNFTSVPALKVNFPVNSIRKTGGGLVEIGRGLVLLFRVYVTGLFYVMPEMFSKDQFNLTLKKISKGPNELLRIVHLSVLMDLY